MYPHERSLVTKMKNRPFVLLGVNTDDSLEELKQAISSNSLNWRSWWDGPNKPGSGPISRAYEVDGFPTLFVIDHKGQVRKKFVGAPTPSALDKVIDQLVKEAEAGQGH